MIQEFTDTDYAVIMDALLITSEKIRAEGRATSNLDVVRQKMGTWAAPTGCEFTVLTGDDTTDPQVLDRLRAVHDASKGKGDQGAFDVWNEVADILGEEERA